MIVEIRRVMGYPPSVVFLPTQEELHLMEEVLGNKVIDDEAYKSHMESFFGTYRGDKGRLTELIGLVGYDDRFRAACMEYLGRTS